MPISEVRLKKALGYIADKLDELENKYIISPDPEYYSQNRAAIETIIGEKL